MYVTKPPSTLKPGLEWIAVSCVGCGICAVECPMPRYRNGYSPRNDGHRRADRLRAFRCRRVRIVAFLCKRSATGAMAAAGAVSLGISFTWRSSARGLWTMLVASTHFQEGAAGVLVAGCRKGNCASVTGPICPSTSLRGEDLSRRQASTPAGCCSPRWQATLRAS